MGSTVRAERRTLDDAWLVLPIVLPAFISLVAPLGTIDLAYHLRLGAQILETGRLVDADTFTFAAAGSAWTDQQWLAQVILELVHRVGSWSGVAVLGAALIGTACGFTAAACRARSAPIRWASVLAIGAFVVAAPMLAVRPQLFAVAVIAVAVLAVATRDRRPWRIWLLPAAAAFLANVHGSFPIVVVLAVLAAGEDIAGRRPRWRVSAAAAAVTIAATLLNPFGIGVWRYVADIARNPTIRNEISEWAPLSLGRPAGVLVAISVFGVIVVGIVHRSRIRTIDVVWLIVFLAPAVASERAAVWWALTFPVVVAGWLADEGGTDGADPPRVRIRTPVLVGSAVVLVLALPTWRGGPALEDAPPGVTAAVSELPQGTRALVQQSWGSWFEWATPHVLPYVDSRIELFPAEVWERYDAVAAGGVDADDDLSSIGADVVVGETTWPLVGRLREDPGWRLVYEGDDGVVLRRR